jgi:predicted Zn-dependent protease with MMP-like domain
MNDISSELYCGYNSGSGTRCCYIRCSFGSGILLIREYSVRRVISPLKTEFLLNYIYSGRTSQETHYVSATKPNRLMLFREAVAVYCENHTVHTATFCGQNAEF